VMHLQRKPAPTTEVVPLRSGGDIDRGGVYIYRIECTRPDEIRSPPAICTIPGSVFLAFPFSFQREVVADGITKQGPFACLEIESSEIGFGGGCSYGLSLDDWDGCSLGKTHRWENLFYDYNIYLF